MLRCTTPKPPSRASAIAMRASVTVSIAAETTGTSSTIVRVNRVAVETAFGRTDDSAGTSRTSSKVSPSFANFAGRVDSDGSSPSFSTSISEWYRASRMRPNQAYASTGCSSVSTTPACRRPACRGSNCPAPISSVGAAEEERTAFGVERGLDVAAGQRARRLGVEIIGDVARQLACEHDELRALRQVAQLFLQHLELLRPHRRSPLVDLGIRAARRI